MKIFKKIISLLLTIVMLMTVICVAPVTIQAAEDYRAWKQTDSRWSSIPMGRNDLTIGGYGCLVSSITKLIIQSGLKSASDFNIATMANWLNSNGGYDGNGCLYWAKPSSCVPGFSYYGTLAGEGTYSSSGYNSQIIAWIKSGYHMVLRVNTLYGQHWVAVDEAKTLATGTVYIMDSGFSPYADATLVSKYSSFCRVEAYKGGSTPSSGYAPQGVVDSITGGTNSVTVRGWAFDTDNTSQSLEIHVYIGASSLAAGGEGHKLVANVKRDDVNSVYGCGSYHGYHGTITTSKTGTQPVYVFAVNIGGGTNVLIGEGTVNIDDSDSPVVTNVKISESDASSFTVSCNVTDAGTISKVYMSTWYTSDKANTEKWFTATVSETVATCKIPISEFDGKEGSYTVHVYAYDEAGNYGFNYIITDFNLPKGCVDYIVNSGNSIHIKGWAFDKDNLEENLAIHVYIGGPAGLGELHAIAANVERQDVDNVYNCGAYHGFNSIISTSKTGIQDVYVYAINIGNGDNVFLDSETVNITNDTESPIVSNIVISDVTSTSYVVTCDVSDNYAVNAIKFPSWYSSEQGDNVIWYEGFVKDGVASCTIPYAEISGESGTYYTHVYAYDGAGNCGTGKTSIEIDMSEFEAEFIEHEHGWDEGVVASEPTCTENGVKTHTCTCGESYTETIFATGHAEVIDKGYDATDTENGLTDGKHCSVCGEVLVVQKVIPAKGQISTEGTAPTEPTTESAVATAPTEPTTESSTGDEDKPTDSTAPVVVGLLGDVNGDGKVNVKDATLIQKAAAKIIELTDEEKLRADVNADNKNNVKDATAIQKFAAKIETGFPVGEPILSKENN